MAGYSWFLMNVENRDGFEKDGRRGEVNYKLPIPVTCVVAYMGNKLPIWPVNYLYRETRQ